jgi:SAM-dependent methyltransferase
VTPTRSGLAEQFGEIDIYLFDQLLRGRIAPDMTVLDAGCGTGRNLAYLLRSGHDVMGVDEDATAIAAVRRLAAELAPRLPSQNFRVEPIEKMSFADAAADVVIGNAVLHFARDERHFGAMLNEMWRVLGVGGMLFCRLASTIGMEGRFRHISGRRFQLLDGAERFLVDEQVLMDATARLGGDLLDPLKTTVVQSLRCMTTWVVRKRNSEKSGA